MHEENDFVPYDFDNDDEEENFKDEPQVRPTHITLIFLSVMFCVGVLIAIQDLSFQQAVEGEETSTLSYGFYLGTIDISSLLFCILLGCFVSEIGSKRMFILGLLIKYISCLIFGALGFIGNENFFFTVSFVSQAIGGLGKSLVYMGAFTTLLMFFEENCWVLIALCVSMYQTGYILVPAIFGFHVNLNLVFVPFLILAFVVFVFLIVSYIYLPHNYFLRDVTISRCDTLLSSLIHFRVWVIAFCSAAVSAYLGFLAVSFEQSVKPLELSSHEIGWLFSIPCLTMAICTPLWGRLLDRNVHPLYFMLSGGMIATLGVCVFGPPPGFPLKSSFYNITPGLFAFGIGASGLFIPSFAYMKTLYNSLGYPNDPTAHGLISGIFLTMAAVGGILGPVIGAVFLKVFDFFGANLLFLMVYGAVVLTVIALIIIRAKCGIERTENPDNYVPDEYVGYHRSSKNDRSSTFQFNITQPNNQKSNRNQSNIDLRQIKNDSYEADEEGSSSRSSY